MKSLERQGRASRQPARTALTSGMLLALGLAPTLAEAATVMVTSPGDTLPSAPATCTLRQAILTMNNSTVSGNCTAAAGTIGDKNSDTISFSPNVFNGGSASAAANTITLADDAAAPFGTLDITDDNLSIDASQVGGVTIKRPRAGTDNTNAFRILRHKAPRSSSTPSSLILNQLTISNGNAGGGSCYTEQVLNAGGICSVFADLTLIDSTVSNNTARGNAGGIYSRDGKLTLRRSTVSNNSSTGQLGSGGGIAAGGGVFVMADSTVSGNTVKGYGGGIILQSTNKAYISNSVISGNTSTQVGGGIILDPGTKYNGTGAPTLVATNVTISGNTSLSGAGGGIGLGDRAGAVLTNVTITGNNSASTMNQDGTDRLYAGGIFGLVRNTVKINNSIVVGNTARDPGGNLQANTDIGAPWSGSYNVSAGNVPDNGVQNIHNIGSAAADLKLGPLQNNGGLTATMLPGVGSTALDAIDSAACIDADGNAVATDQRGVRRPQNGKCDIGAVEVRGGSFNLNVTVAGSGSVSATPKPSGSGSSGDINGCTSSGGSACAAVFARENNVSTVTLKATQPAAGQALVWGGSCIAVPGMPTQATVTMDQSRTCTATFANLTIAPTGLPSGTYGAQYTAGLSAGGGTAPYSFALAPGSTLPAGLTLTATGGLSGTPTAAADTAYSFAVVVTDANGFAGNPQTLSANIAKAALIVKANDVSRTFGAPGPTFSASYTGFIPGDTAANSLTALPTFTTNATSVSPVGAGYVIAPAGAVSAKYAPTYQNGSLAITSASSATALMQSLPAGSVSGQSVVFTVTTTNTSAGSTAVPNGTVSFNEGGIALSGCSAVPLDGTGKAQCQTASLAVGSHSVTANYAPANTNFTGSASSAVTQSVAKAATTTAVTSPGAITLGSPVTVNAQVAVTSPGSGTPSGTITIGDGDAQAGDNCTISLPATSCVLTPSTAGTKTLTAHYSGDGSFGASTAPSGSLTVNPSQPGTALTSSVNPSRFSHGVTFTATVTPAAGGTSPTGSIDFSDGGSALAGCTGLALSGGIASCAASTLSVGSHTIQASYSGDTNNRPSNGALTQTVDKDTTTMSLSASPNPAGAIQPITLTATVFGDPPTGTVTFYDGTAILGTATLTTASALSSSAAVTVGPLGSGTHSLSATYAGDANNEGSASAVLVVTVNAPVVPAPLLSPWLLALLGLSFAGLSARRLRA